jgi:anaerobic magnesium-protoporphyrin IX monomethyl ester cyclase
VTVLGGIHGTFMYGQVLSEAPWIDYIVRGEGEEIVVNLVKAIAEGRMPAERDTMKGTRVPRGRQAVRDPGRIRRFRTSMRWYPTGAF